MAWTPACPGHGCEPQHARRASPPHLADARRAQLLRAAGPRQRPRRRQARLTVLGPGTAASMPSTALSFPNTAQKRPAAAPAPRPWAAQWLNGSSLEVAGRPAAWPGFHTETQSQAAATQGSCLSPQKTWCPGQLSRGSLVQCPPPAQDGQLTMSGLTGLHHTLSSGLLCQSAQ